MTFSDDSPVNNGEVEQRVTDLQTKLLALEAKVKQSREMADQQQKEAKLDEKPGLKDTTTGNNYQNTVMVTHQECIQYSPDGEVETQDPKEKKFILWARKIQDNLKKLENDDDLIENWTSRKTDEIEENLAGQETRMQTVEQNMAEITSKTKENYDKEDKTRIQDIEKDLGNLTTATQTFQIQRREAEMLSERVAILLSYIQGHSKYIWKTLQFLSDFCIHTFDDYIW